MQMARSKRSSSSACSRISEGSIPAARKALKETDLYRPVKRFLQRQGYDVKGEIGDCDVVAIRDGLVLAVELKVQAGLKLLQQAVSRLSCADEVYVALPSSCSALRKD